MREIRAKNTKPELEIRHALHARGIRYRIHVNGLPGKPDIVLPKYRATIFVNGCFWHGHSCPLFRLPKTRREFWESKIDRNRERDKEAQSALASMGWRCLTIWECAIRGPNRRELTIVINDTVAWLSEESLSFQISGIV